jgi:hypothetical protein
VGVRSRQVCALRWGRIADLDLCTAERSPLPAKLTVTR